jgi:hypothetical protein
MKQQSLASQAVFEKFGRKSRLELFLDEMEQVVPWSCMEALVRPRYAKAGKGRQPVGLSLKLQERSQGVSIHSVRAVSLIRTSRIICLHRSHPTGLCFWRIA